MTARQREFIYHCTAGKAAVVGFGGRRGGGKTRGSTFVLCYRALLYPNTLHLILRRVTRATVLSVGKEIRKVLKGMGVPVGSLRRGEVQFDKKEKQFLFPNGAIIQLGFCLKESDWEQYQGGEYTTICFEEATQFPESAWDKIGGSGRANESYDCHGNKARSLKILTFNPGGIGHGWVKRRVWDPKTRDPRTVFIPSGVRDSLATLENDPGYVLKNLRHLSEHLRKQWEDGDMDAVEGAFWKFYSRSGKPVFRKVEVPEWARVYAAVDPGYFPSAYGVVWFAKWRDKAGFRRVHVMADLKRHRLAPRQQAERSLEREAMLPIPVSARYADPQAWEKTLGDKEGAIITAIIWANHGFAVSPAPKTPKTDGWMLIRQLMHDDVLTIDPDCMNLKTEMEEAIHAENSDDMDDACEDHVQDCLRYGMICTMTSYVSREREAKRRRRFRNGRHVARETMFYPSESYESRQREFSRN